jgi:hypothetical protein
LAPKLIGVLAVAAFATTAVAPALAAPAGKAFVCHHTASETNPVVVIHISRNAVDKHLANHGHTGPDEEGAGSACKENGVPDF